MAQTQKEQKTEHYNSKGCKLLAIGVIRSAINDRDLSFFVSPVYDYYAILAYGKNNYKTGEEIVREIEEGKTDIDLRRKNNGGGHSKWF